jgi:hypothetical protein
MICASPELEPRTVGDSAVKPQNIASTEREPCRVHESEERLWAVFWVSHEEGLFRAMAPIVLSTRTFPKLSRCSA